MSHAAKPAADAAIPLGEEYPEIRESVGRMCERFPGSYWQGLEDKLGRGEDSYPHEFVNALGEAGYLATLIPEEYGGAGLPIRAATVVLEEIHAQGCNAAACHAQMYIMGTLLRHGSEEQKRKYLPRIATGELRLQAFGVTEPTSGSDTTKLKTRAVLQGESYTVNGQKIWTSRAMQSDLMLLLARTTSLEEVRRKTDGLSVFLVDMKQALKDGSLEIRPIKAMINHNTTQVFFTNMRVPADSLIGKEGQGFRYILDGMNAERILISSESIGDGRWFTRKSVAYAGERVIFGHPIGSNQGVQFPIAKAHAEIEAAEMMMRKAAAQFDAGRPCGPEANIAKYLAAEAAWHAAEACMQAHGGFAFAREYDVERKWRECRLYQIAPISSNLVLAYVAEHVLGLARSY